MYGRIVSATGWTFEYVRQEMEWPDAVNLLAYWAEYPPVTESLHSICTQFLGFKKKGAEAKNTNPPLSELSRQTGINLKINKKSPPRANAR